MSQMTMRNIPLMDAKAQYNALKDEIRPVLDEVLESGNYIMGPAVHRLEQAVAKYCDVKHAIGVANGTDALLLTLDALGIGPGDEVITTPFTFFATAEAVSQLGGTPVFIDIEPDTYNMDVSKIEAAITDKTKAIIPVHIFGHPVHMDPLMAIAEKYGLHVIEDACQAMGSEYREKRAGSIGTAGCFSFFPTKNLGGFGDGGMVITNDDELARKIRILRVHGSSPKYYHSMIGYNSRLDSLQAAMIEVKLPYLDGWNASRREKAEIYRQGLQGLPLQLPGETDYAYAIYHLYIIQTDERAKLMEYLNEQGISSGIYYPVPLHLQEVYRGLGYEEGCMPEAEKAADGTMALPLYPEMSEEDQQYVIEIVRRFYAERGEMV